MIKESKLKLDRRFFRYGFSLMLWRENYKYKHGDYYLGFGIGYSKVRHSIWMWLCLPSMKVKNCKYNEIKKEFLL